MSFGQQPEKVEALCPECGAKNEILYFPANKFRVEVPGSRAGKSVEMRGRGEKIDGKCKECKYKFTLDDL